MKKNELGFSLIEILLSIIAISLVAGVGYYVYSQNQTKDTSEKTETSAQQVVQEPKVIEETPPKAVEYKEFEDLGIKIEKTETIASINFESEEDIPKAYYLRTTEIDKLYNQCRPSTSDDMHASVGSFMSIAREEGKFKPGSGPVELIKQFDDFHIIAGFPNGSQCGGAQEELDAIEIGKKLRIEAVKAFENSQEL